MGELLACLGSCLTRLSSEDAESRLETYNRNELVQRKKRAGIVEFLMHFRSPLVIILIFAALFSGILQEIPNMVIILSIVFIRVILDYYQESKARKAAELLNEKVTTTTTVFRDNSQREVKLPEIGPGDIIYLSAGAIAPADAEVLNAKNLFINQSAVTGESFSVEKTSAPITGKAASITYWNNYLFMGN